MAVVPEELTRPSTAKKSQLPPIAPSSKVMLDPWLRFRLPLTVKSVVALPSLTLRFPRCLPG